MKKFFTLLVSLFLAVVGMLPTTAISTSFAAEASLIETTSVMEDLEGATIEGNPFSLADYPADSTKSTQLLSFLEYGYEGGNSDKYALYAYVYNPKGLTFNVNSAAENAIQFSVGEEGEYSVYDISYVNRSNDGRFYKYKVLLTDAQKKSIYDAFSGERTYSVSGITLVDSASNNPTEYTVGKIYKYSGSTSDGTLSCVSSSIDVLELEVYPTQYRPEGTNSEGFTSYTQDSLHSVYFAIPNEYLTDNGEMTAVHARWLDAVLLPQLVTGNKEVYDATVSLLGKNIGVHTDESEYAFTQNLDYISHGQGVNSYYVDFAYNMPTTIGSAQVQGPRQTELYAMYYAGEGTDSADNYTVSSEDIKERMDASAQLYGGELVNDKYSKKIFSSVAEDWTDITIRADEEYSLTSHVISENFWERLFGNGTYIETFDGIKAIQALKDEDFEGTPEEVCDRLYVSSADYNHLFLYYSALKNTHTVYLFRYQVSDYSAWEVEEHRLSYSEGFLGIGAGYSYSMMDSNAYFFSETVNLGFDIIEIEVKNDLGRTWIPVLHSPQDIVPDATPPVDTNSDCSNIVLPWWVWLIIAGAVMGLLFPVFQLLKVVIGGVWWGIKLPFRFLRWLFGGKF